MGELREKIVRILLNKLGSRAFEYSSVYDVADAIIAGMEDD